MQKVSKRMSAYALLLINVVTWGAALPIVKWGLPDTTPFRYLFYRFLLAAFFSLPIFFVYAKRIKNVWESVKIITLHEILGTSISLSLLYLGLRSTTALDASMIVTTTPIFITLGGIWFLHEREERHEWLGLFIAFMGTIGMTFLPPLLSGQHLFGGSFVGNGLIFLQNIATAAYFILAKKYYKTIPKLFVATISFYVGIITFGILSLWEAGGVAALNTLMLHDLSSPSVWIVILYMAIFGSIIGLTAYIAGQNQIEASEASVFGYLHPAIYIPLSFLLLGERVSLVQLFFLALVFLGVYITERRSISSKRQRKNIR